MKIALIVVGVLLASFGFYGWHSELRSNEALPTTQRNAGRNAWPSAAAQDRLLPQGTAASGAKTSEAEALEKDPAGPFAEEGSGEASTLESLPAAPNNPLAAFQATIARIKAQPYDKAWAVNTESEIAASFVTILNSRQANPQGTPAQIRDVDCRRDACVVSVEWPSYGQASVGWESLLLSPMKPNCDREIVLDESLDLNGPYPTQVAVTNCTP